MTDLRFSRIAATATGLAASATDASRFLDKRVLLTGTTEALRTQNGGEIAFCSLLLLMRMCRNIVVSIPPGMDELASRLREAAAKYAWDEVPLFATPEDNASFDAILSIGGVPKTEQPLTVITSKGWLARVTSGPTPISQDCGLPNAVGALAAASLGAGEVFKRLLPLAPERGVLLDGCEFSLWTYSVGGEGCGPELTTTLNIDVLVAGGGAIGNGVAYLLSRMRFTGRASVVDPQSYGEENWGTCLLVSPDNISQPKASFIADVLSNNLDVDEPHECTIEQFAKLQNWRVPTVVLNGLDNVPARYEAQDLWPDLIIDGALGPLLECQVSGTICGDSNACLRCIFEEEAGPSAEAIQSQVTGLARSSLQNLEQVLTEEDIRLAALEHRDWLKTQQGQTKCSIVAKAQALSSEKLNDNFRPSVPFVATMSAAMMVTELVRHYTGSATELTTRFQFSVLWGPERGEMYPQNASPTCQCVVRRDNIEKVRALRAR